MIETPVKAFAFLKDVTHVSQPEAQKMIAKGRVLVEGVPMTNNAGMISGNVGVIVFVPEAPGIDPLLELPGFVLFDKPSGILAHPNKRDMPGTILDEARVRYGRHANTLHRIDRETSGLLMVGKNKKAERTYKMMFENKQMKKSYLALARGIIEKEQLIDLPILTNPSFERIKLKVIIDEKGKPSQTIIKPVRHFENATLLEVNLLTGRQHQIRVHLNHIGHPIIGDPIYGVDYHIAARYLDKQLSREERIRFMGAKRLMLHAYKLEFEHIQRFVFISKQDFTGECEEVAG